MQVALWVFIIHVIELIGVGIFILVNKVNKLEKIVSEQQQYIDAVSIAINNSNEQLKEMDQTGVFQADDEVGWFFKNLREIQNMLNSFRIDK
jgi:hypothetical protein